jgi:hypothetical protein
LTQVKAQVERAWEVIPVLSEDREMQTFRASFYKDLPNSEGHVFRCLERQFDITAKDIVKALSATEEKLAFSGIEVDAVEVAPVLPHPTIT